MNEQLLAGLQPTGPKKILACDGGGILGLMTVEILAKLEGDLRGAEPAALSCAGSHPIGGKW